MHEPIRKIIKMYQIKILCNTYDFLRKCYISFHTSGIIALYTHCGTDNFCPAFKKYIYLILTINIIFQRKLNLFSHFMLPYSAYKIQCLRKIFLLRNIINFLLKRWDRIRFIRRRAILVFFKTFYQ